MESHSFKRIICGLVLVCLLALIGREFFFAHTRYAHRVSPVADGYSEANSLRGAQSFLDQGLLPTVGLPDINYGDLFSSIGIRVDLGHTDPHVYTHYPPGPEWLNTGFILMCGGIELACVRTYAVALGASAVLCFAMVQFLCWEWWKACALIGVLCCLPMFTNMMHGLHAVTYGYAFFLLQLSLIVLLVRYERRLPLMLAAPGLFVLGFIQGWLSFDYFFLVAFGGLPLLLLHRVPRKVGLVTSLVPGAGFVFAHILHFLQVVVYLGGLGPAIADLGTAAVRRFDNSVEAVGGIPSEGLEPLNLFLQYLVQETAQDIHFGLFFVPVLLLVVGFLLVPKVSGKVPFLPHLRWTWKRPRRAPSGVALSLFVSSLWVLVMRQHAYIHTHFIPRHYFLFFLVSFFILLEGFSVCRVQTQQMVKGQRT